jgi:purine-nucleoside phosphorylase
MSGGAHLDFIDRCRETRPEVLVVLGSGVGILGDRITPLASVWFSDIPGLPSSTVAGHRGRWTLGLWAGRVVIVSEGRLHYYEGHPWEVAVRPIQLAAKLGVRVAVLTNAAGGIRNDLGPGSLMPIRDHLEWNRPNPWRQPRAPSPYSTRLLNEMTEAAAAMGLPVSAGVYGAVTGPSYETPAEIRALRSAGADAVGMSTSREALAGVEAGLECVGVSLITNRAAGLTDERLSHDEVLAAGRASAGRLLDLIEQVALRLRNS